MYLRAVDKWKPGDRKSPQHMAMGQNPVPPVNIPIPTKSPKWDLSGVDPRPHGTFRVSYIESLPLSKVVPYITPSLARAVVCAQNHAIKQSLRVFSFPSRGAPKMATVFLLVSLSNRPANGVPGVSMTLMGSSLKIYLRHDPFFSGWRLEVPKHHQTWSAAFELFPCFKPNPGGGGRSQEGGGVFREIQKNTNHLRGVFPCLSHPWIPIPTKSPPPF